MKTILILLLASFNCFSASFIVNQSEVAPDYSFKFIFSNSKAPNYTLELDCQSYFFKLDAFNSEGELLMENYLSFGECEYLWENFNSCIETTGSKCVDSTDIFSSDCSCNQL